MVLNDLLSVAQAEACATKPLPSFAILNWSGFPDFGFGSGGAPPSSVV
jgi:hypothetical protein